MEARFHFMGTRLEYSPDALVGYQKPDLKPEIRIERDMKLVRLHRDCQT
jgi:hypothetical protein